MIERQATMPTSIKGFEGLWRLTKGIEDRKGQPSSFIGSAKVSLSDSGWSYDEFGKVRISDGTILNASRRYLWMETEGAIDICFDDGRPFHRMAMEGGEAAHDCPPDIYRVSYDFAGWPREWSATWVVVGPRKDYAMHCRYVRDG